MHMTSGDSDDEDLLDDDEPQLDTVMIQHNGAINRIRVRTCATCVTSLIHPVLTNCVKYHQCDACTLG